MGNCCSASHTSADVSPVRVQAQATEAAKEATPAPGIKAQRDRARPPCKLRTDAKVRDVYKIGKTLGTGGYAVVKLATDRETSKEYAVKIMNLPPDGTPVGDNDNTREDIFKEIDILVGMNHPNVIFLKEYFEEGNKVYLITELLLGGELLDAVLERGSYNEEDAQMCIRQLLSGIEYLHANGVVHRDLKLENLLLAARDDISCIKIADFGLAKKAVESMNTICGTPQYVAPEVILGTPGLRYGPGVDLWAAGVVLFILLGGYPPFFDENEPSLFDLIRKGDFKFDDPVWDTISDGAKDLICQLLVTDPTKRPSATQALQHQWLQQALKSPALLDATRSNLRRQTGPKFRNVVLSIVAQQRMTSLSRMVSSGEAAARETLLRNPDDMHRMTEAARRLEEREAKQKEVQDTSQ